MTLLFYLRSPAGNTDAITSGDGGRHWKYEELKQEREIERKDARRKRKEELKAKRLAAKELLEATVEAEKARRKKKKDEQLLMILFMHEFNGYEH